MIVLDEDHLAFWERAKRASLDNLHDNPKVSVIYSNRAAAQRGDLEHPAVSCDFMGPQKSMKVGNIATKYEPCYRNERSIITAQKKVMLSL